MKKLITAAFMVIVAGSAFAEVNCFAEHGNEVIEIRVIDTFVDRTAFISRTHPTVIIPTIDISVQSQEKSKSVVFVNKEHDFALSVDKRFAQRSLPPSYKAELTFGNISTHMNCTVD